MIHRLSETGINFGGCLIIWSFLNFLLNITPPTNAELFITGLLCFGLGVGLFLLSTKTPKE